MDWVRGEVVGHGSFGTVSLAVPRSQGAQIPALMAVKSCGASHSASLLSEKLLLDELNDCPQIISCYGDSYSTEGGVKLYNVLLEYASEGALADKLKNSGDCQLPEFEVRRYTKAILKGLQYIHKNGYVHCDIKLQNILLGRGGAVKIADFGLAKRIGEKDEQNSGCELRGTPLYMSPEMVAGGEQGMPADVWALGCVVAEMVSGAPAWRCASDVAGLLMRIGVGDEVPEIPGKLSDEGKDFLGKCFVKDPRKRWTAEMLLDHPFVADYEEDMYDTVTSKGGHDVSSTSPRCPFDFPDWASSATCSITSLTPPEKSADSDSWLNDSSCWSSSPAERLRGLVGDRSPDWSFGDDWVTIR